MTQPSDVAPAVIGDSIRMLEQCGLWSTWLGEPPALPGKPCNFVNTSRPELVFGVPDGTKDHMTFQPHLDEGKNWQRFHSDSLMPGGTGPIPTLRQYLRLLRSSRIARGSPGVHVVQVGANLGGREFNEWVHPLLRANPSWTGVVIEPVPRVFQKLAENYESERSRVQPMNVAIATRSGPCEMQVNKKNLQSSTLALGEQVHGIRCFTEQRSCRYLKEHSYFVPMQVNCSTLEDALAARHPHLRLPVDLLVLDTEMFDYTLLRTIRLDLIRPLAIEFETKAFTMQQGAEIASLLSLYGYLCRFAPFKDPENDMLSSKRTALQYQEYGDSAYNRAYGAYNRSAAAEKLERARVRALAVDELLRPKRSKTRSKHLKAKGRAAVLVELGKVGLQTMLEAVCYRML